MGIRQKGTGISTGRPVCRQPFDQKAHALPPGQSAAGQFPGCNYPTVPGQEQDRSPFESQPADQVAACLQLLLRQGTVIGQVQPDAIQAQRVAQQKLGIKPGRFNAFFRKIFLRDGKQLQQRQGW